MKTLLYLILFISTVCVKAQIVEINTEKSSYRADSTNLAAEESKNVELFSRALVDYGFEGQIQTTTQALKINIGEPTKLYLPIYLLVGATSGDFGSDQLNKSTILGLINPTGGLLNLSTNLYKTLVQSESKISSIKLSLLGGAKLLTGRSTTTNNSKANIGFFADGGITLQTGAWTADPEGDGTSEYKDGGIAWLQLKYSYMNLSKDDLKDLFGQMVTDTPHGPRIEFGIYIKDRVNIKLSYFKTAVNTNIPTLNDSQFRLAFDYNVSKK